MIYFTTSVVRSHFNCFFFSFFVLVALNNPHFTHWTVGKMWVRLAHCSPSLGCCSLTTAVKSNVFPNWLVSVLWLSLSEKNHKEGNAKKKSPCDYLFSLADCCPWFVCLQTLTVTLLKLATWKWTTFSFKVKAVLSCWNQHASKGTTFTLFCRQTLFISFGR